ncbi:MAG TPA: hypothetical protein PLM58_02255 [Novosphingobium sp.]|nr:MAG: hypothetical protein B7X92_02195 [Novosphingobium sp. 17-62-9]HQS68423.1 hypothetical protein [Novosphingobium sp.]
MRATSSATMKQLLSASGLALATALVASGPSLKAQSFNASSNVVGGSATIFTTPTTTAITVSSPSAVINWTPNDTAATGGPINFQSAGTTATFQNDFNTQNFAVLNRIIPSGSTRPVQFNGEVISQLQQFSAPPTRGGTVFFYSPGGILIGGGSVFDVGNLVLTTSDLSFDAEGNFDSNGSYVFRPVDVPGSQIVVNAGAQLNAPVEGSYIALVAPSVVNNGTIAVNGSAALVAADAATITFSPNGLFDIEVTSGTSATGAVLTNNGSVEGPASGGQNFFNRVYMVAVPKNDAITMAIGAGSALGFDIAGAANAVGNTIILSAGHDVVGGEAGITPSTGGGSGLVSITGGDSVFSSAVDARATGTISLEATQPDGMTFAGQALLRATGGNSSITAGAGSFVNFDSFLLFSASTAGTSANPNAQAGGVALRALDGGAITAAGSVDLTASGVGAASSVVGTNSGNGTGGTILVEALNGGTIAFEVDLVAIADGIGGFPETGLNGVGGGNGTGGTVTFRSAGTGLSDIQIAAGINITATGIGGTGNGCTTCQFDGGTAIGGIIGFESNGTGKTIDIRGLTDLSALANGGIASVGSGGSATGGTISAVATNGGRITLRAFNAATNAQGGSTFGTFGGTATGGVVNFAASGTGIGGIGVTGDLFLEANATGGIGQSQTSSGGTATGGAITVSARDEKFVSVTGNLFANSNANGGLGFNAPAAGTGGLVTVEATTAGLMSVTGLAGLSAQGTGGESLGAQSGGVGTGGIATLRSAGGQVTISNDLSVNAEGRGGAQVTNGIAGAGQGGTAQIVIGSSGRIDLLQDADVLAEGRGGASGSGPDTIGGNGTGGNARLNLGGGTLDITGKLTLGSAGSGGGGGAQGGNGLGGTTSITQTGNTLIVGADSSIGATGTGGPAFFGSTGGSGTGGTITMQATQSTASFSALGDATLDATGFGAIGTVTGAGTGGTIQITATASTIGAGNALQILAEGQGGDGGFNGGNGALGTGGQISLTASGSVLGASRIEAPTLNISATGRGGDGTGQANAAAGPISQAGSGGNGLGGTIALVSAPDGGTIAAQQLTAAAAGAGGLGANGASASGPGGDAGSGGSAVGGQITFGSVRGNGTALGGFELGAGLVDAGAIGANGGTGGAGFPPGRGGSGGNATGGTITMEFDAGGSRLAVAGGLQVLANATGGNTGPCFTACVVAAGVGTGGTIKVGSDGLTSGNTISAQSLELSAFGVGGNSSTASGAQGIGGNVQLLLGSGMALTVGDVSLNALAEGGDSSTDEVADLVGGAALGGSAQFVASGTSSANISGQVGITARGSGGFSAGPGGIGGNGTGGTARLFSAGGAISIEGGVGLDANGTGGDGQLDGATGVGGSGQGGSALLGAGNQTLLGNGGSISVLGLVNASADAGAGIGQVAGSAVGGQTSLTARQGTVQLSTVVASANAFGANGASGGAGGAATAGTISIVAHNAVEGPALLQATEVITRATARGGNGAEFIDPNAPLANGGLAQGGSISILGSAGNGRIDIDQVDASADATGGTGGIALSGTAGTGGLATGGTIQLGLTSGIPTGTVNTGSAQFGAVEATASGFGGSGGQGEQTGGNGGNAVGGGITLLAQGGPVSIAAASTFDANANGGTGGAGPVTGNGGNATISPLSGAASLSGVKIQVSERINQPAQRGGLTASDLTLRALATGGAGTTGGTSTMANSALGFVVTNGDVSANSLVMSAAANAVNPTALADTFTMSNSSAAFATDLTISTPNAFSLTLDNANATADSVSMSARNWLLAGPAPATLGTLTGRAVLQLLSTQDLVGHANLASDTPINLASVGRISFGAVSAPGFITADAGTSLTLGNVTSQQDVTLTANTNLVVGTVSALGPVLIDAGGNVTTGSVTAGTGLPSAAGTSPLTISAGGRISTANLSSSSDVLLYAQGDIGTGRISAFDALILGTGNTALGGFDRANRVLIANRAMAFPASGGTPTKEQILSANPIATTGSVSFEGPSTLGTLRIAAGTTAATSDVLASGNIGMTSAGNGTFGALRSTGGNIELLSQTGSLAAAGIDARFDVLARAATGLNLQTVSGRDIALLSAGNVQVGSARAGVVISPASGAITGATGRLLIANASMLPAGALPGSIDYAALFAAAPVSTAGSVNLGRTIAGRMTGAAAGILRGDEWTAFERIDATSATQVTVAQRWTAPVVRIGAGNIAVINNSSGGGAAGQPLLSGIRTAVDGSVDLVSTSGGTVLIGDGLTAQDDFSLTDEEIGLISTGRLTIAAADSAANAIDMRIGNLNLTAGGTIGATMLAGPNGRIIFATGNAATQALGGTIRVTGAINGTGFGSGNVVEFSTGTFELDAATGSISLTSTGTTLGGIAEFNAANIHIASADILDRLAADPLYSDRIADLNAPAIVQRPEGVLRALGLDFYPTGTLYIQNTGTVLNPAGFFSDIAFTDVTAPANAQPGAISVIVNGAFQTPSGIVSGFDAHELAVAGVTDPASFSDDSQINGCLFSVTRCVILPGGDGEPDVIGAISGQITFNATEPLGSTPEFGSPDGEEDEADVQLPPDESGTAGPIVPPTSIINAAPLDAASPIEEPVSGGGNPALIGSSSGSGGNGNLQGDVQ